MGLYGTTERLHTIAVMPCSRGQASLEAKILSSDSASKNCYLSLSSNVLFWPRENECNDETGNLREFAILLGVLYQSYPLRLLPLMLLI